MFDKLQQKSDRILKDAASSACVNILEEFSGIEKADSMAPKLKNYLAQRDPETNFTHRQLLAQAFQDIHGTDADNYICFSHQNLGKHNPSIEIQEWHLNSGKKILGFVINLDTFFSFNTLRDQRAGQIIGSFICVMKAINQTDKAELATRAEVMSLKSHF